MNAKQAISSAFKRDGYAGYKAIDVDDIPWTICMIHGEAHPLDFPCTACGAGLPSRIKSRTKATFPLE